MKVISSQRFLSDEILDQKIEEISGTSVNLPVVDSGLTGENGEALYILIDGHHRLAAAKEIGCMINFYEIDNDTNLTGEDLLEANWLDSDWYYVDTKLTVWC